MNRYQTTRTINILLQALAVGGLIGGTLVAPNATELLTRLAKPLTDIDVDEKELKRLLSYMERTKLVELSVRDGSLYGHLTNKAKERLRSIELDEISIKDPRKWDKKWRILIYDIPSYKKLNRFYLLSQLHRLNFYKLQDSTWVYPYPCSVEVMEILDRLELSRYVTFIVGVIETKDEATLIKHYQLYKRA